MRIIDVPSEPAKFTLLLQDGKKEFTTTFIEFLQSVIDGHAGFAKGPKNARQYNQICDVIDAYEEKAEGEDKVLQFEDTDWEVLVAAMNAAEWKSPKINRAYIGFYKLIEDAQKVSTPTKK